MVYPAASLVHYVPLDIPKFIVDKKLPETNQLYNLRAIEKVASEGMQEVTALLRDYK